LLRFRQNLETISNIVVVGTALLICFVLLGQILSRSYDPRASHFIGKQLPELKLIGPLLTKHSSWHYPSNAGFVGSLPFYSRLDSARVGHSLQLVVLTPESVAGSASFLHNSNISPDRIIQKLSAVDISAKPTLLLVNKGGTVERAWVGKLSPSSEEDAIRAILR